MDTKPFAAAANLPDSNVKPCSPCAAHLATLMKIRSPMESFAFPNLSQLLTVTMRILWQCQLNIAHVPVSDTSALFSEPFPPLHQTMDATRRAPIPCTVNVTPNRMVSKHYFDPRGIRLRRRTFSSNYFFCPGYSFRARLRHRAN